MTPPSAPLPNPATMLPPQRAILPPLWSQLDATQRRQLVQTLAELMRRIQLSTLSRKEMSHDHA